MKQNNLDQFIHVVKKAYAASKVAGTIPAGDISIYDQLVACPAVVYPSAGRGQSRPIYLHRQWRRQVIKLYRRQHRRFGGFLEDINWEEIWAWVLENIVPIIKLIIKYAPLFI